MESHVAVRLTNFTGGLTGKSIVHNLTESCKQFTKTRNKTKQQVINEWVAKQIVVKYLQGEIFFATSSNLFLTVEYATNCQSYAKEVELTRFGKWFVLI